MSYEIKDCSTKPFEDQKPGTSGLRKKTAIFQQEHYLANFIQATFKTLSEEYVESFRDQTLVVGGDGRFYNSQAIQLIVRMAVANGFSRVMVAKDGILSTPAASAVIRKHKTLGGFILSASHNPGGPDEDFGIKFNAPNGGPAPQQITNKIFAFSKTVTSYLLIDSPDVDLSSIGSIKLNETEIVIFNPLEDYTALMRRLFDFDTLKGLFAGGFTMRFDAMNAVTGPYAKHILEDCLGAAPGTVVRAKPLPDFGGVHPDPNLIYAAELVEHMNGINAPDLGAASDGDGDRNLILGRNAFVSPGDSLAVITDYATKAIPGYKTGLKGVARSMPTSKAVDRVAEALNITCYETPTGWKFFGNLMDAELCTLCGEESFGTGSSHVREKDGLWAVLAWLSIIANSGKSVEEILLDHWKRYGRSYFQRHDYEGLNKELADELFAELSERLTELAAKPFASSKIMSADDFSYLDPVDGSEVLNQGIRLCLEDGSRAIFRLSGTGTQGATLRIYLESYERSDLNSDVSKHLEPLSQAVQELLELKRRFGVTKATVIT